MPDIFDLHLPMLVDLTPHVDPERHETLRRSRSIRRNSVMDDPVRQTAPVPAPPISVTSPSDPPSCSYLSPDPLRNRMSLSTPAFVRPHPAHMPVSDVVPDVVVAIVGAGIRMLALDFDETLISVHTGSDWTESAEKLANYFRSVFRLLILQSLDAGVHVAIVTRSNQTGLIRNVLDIVLTPLMAARVVIRGEDRSWNQSADILTAGKSQHIISAWRHFHGVSCAISPLTWESILLIDDDRDAVTIMSRHCGGKAYLFDRNRSEAEMILGLRSRFQCSTPTGSPMKDEEMFKTPDRHSN